MLTLIGILAGTLFMSLMAGIAIGRRIKAVNNARDEHADWLGVDPGFHIQSNTHREQCDHV